MRTELPAQTSTCEYPAVRWETLGHAVGVTHALRECFPISPRRFYRDLLTHGPLVRSETAFHTWPYTARINTESHYRTTLNGDLITPPGAAVITGDLPEASFLLF